MNNIRIRHLCTLILTFMVVTFNPLSRSQAKVWSNAYIRFEIPDRWDCILESTEWVCRSKDGEEAKEAIIILTAKEEGPTDQFPIYESHLTNPIMVTLRGGGTQPSKPQRKPEFTQIQNHRWIDGFHLGSEVPNYFTRYLATIKNKIAVLVTFSAHTSVYAKYSLDFNKAIQSLSVIATANLTRNSDPSIGASGGCLIGCGKGPGVSDLPGVDPLPPTSKKKDKTLYIALAVILAALAGYILYKARKK